MTEYGDKTGREDDDHSSTELTFSLTGLYQGYLQCVPIALGVAGYGILFGVLARQSGLTPFEATLMSATVLAGAAQLIAVELWSSPVPAAAILLTTFIVNLRYVLMGAALRPWFSKLTPLQAYGSIFFTADENWALTIKELRDGNQQGAFLLGSGLAIWSFWVVATIVGSTAGGVIDDPSVYGLDFVLTAVFLTLVVGFWEGTETALSWSFAAGTAILGFMWLPGRWYILIGGLTASLIKVMRYD